MAEPLAPMERIDTDAEVIFFVSSAGRCNIDCQYCIVEPAGRREDSLSYEDLEFLYRHFDKKAFFMFSGKGDFFSGYPASEQLLGRLLDLDVDVGLDINATILRELPELPDWKLAKIRHVNVAMHYHEMVRFNLLERWVQNARWIVENLDHAVLIVGHVLDPALAHEWDEAFDFYEREIFGPTGKKLLPIRHLNHEYTAEENRLVDEVTARHASIVEDTFCHEYGAMFSDVDEVLCPAGKSLFRVWNDGTVQGCSYKPELQLLGGLKERVINEKDAPHRCSTPDYCDCCLPAILGKMGYP